MPVKYNDKFIIPAPFASINKEQNRTGDGRLIGDLYNITLSGSFLSYFSGIYDSYNDNTKSAYVSDEALSQLMTKQRELLELFQVEGKKLEIIGIDDATSRVFLPTTVSIDFGEGNWAQLCEYTITLTATTLLDKNGDYITPPESGIPLADGYHLMEADDKYTMENNEDGSATIIRAITAKGSLVYDPNNPGQILNGTYPWQYASGWCATQDQEDIEMWYSGIIETILPNFEVIDTKTDIDVAQTEGNYSIERGWIVSNTGVYILARNTDETVESPTELSLNLDIQGLGFTAQVKYDYARTFWDDGAGGYITDTTTKVNKIRSYFTEVGADQDSWFFRSFGESNDKPNGSISDNVALFGHSGVYHTYTIDANTSWLDLPDATISLNGNIAGTGIETSDKMDSALSYYTTIDFTSLLEQARLAEWASSGTPYLQSQSLSLDHETGEVSYTRDYSNHITPYKDTWTVDHSMEENGGGNDGVTVAGTIQGISPIRDERWTQVYNAFITNFPDDATVWNSKVAPVLLSKTPASGYVNTRNFTYDDITGSIGYNYSWSASPNSATLDYAVDASYDRVSKIWTVNLNGTAKGVGTNPDERIFNAMQVVPGESGAWSHAYYTLVDRIDDNSQVGDDPYIGQIPPTSYMTTRSLNADEREGVVTFNYSWQSAESSTINTYTTDYSWDEATATETVTVNGTIKSINGSGDLESAWHDDVWRHGDPICPETIYAGRHQNSFPDQSAAGKIVVKDQLPAVAPISSTAIPSIPFTFDRQATIDSSSYSIDLNNDQANYSIVFTYRAWPYNLPLWLTDVSISWTDTPAQYVWAEKQIIGKLSGPVHQNMTSRGSQTFDYSISLSVSKRKQDQFGRYMGLLLSEYTEYILGKLFLDKSGYSVFIYGNEDVNKNCYLQGDNFNYDEIGGSCSRTGKIVMLNILV